MFFYLNGSEFHQISIGNVISELHRQKSCSADKTNGLLRVDAFLVNTGTCWPTVGG